MVICISYICIYYIFLIRNGVNLKRYFIHQYSDICSIPNCYICRHNVTWLVFVATCVTFPCLFVCCLFVRFLKTIRKWRLSHVCNVLSGGFHGSGYKALVEVSRRSQGRIIKTILVFCYSGHNIYHGIHGKPKYLFQIQRSSTSSDWKCLITAQVKKTMCSICKQIWNVIILNKHLLNLESWVFEKLTMKYPFHNSSDSLLRYAFFVFQNLNVIQSVLTWFL